MQRGTSRLAPTCQSVYYRDSSYTDWVAQICPYRLGFYGMNRDVVDWAAANVNDLWACHAEAFKHEDAPDLPMGYEMLFSNENDAFLCRMLHGGIVGGRPPKPRESAA
ncbi:MAG: hypothetical protein EOP84_02910 [Verrucomicrobiaceae bacterium]|nr:MAG: hypothetical protein EOP84_02910 [Verrucomicrobiaceae bacterium]